MKTATMISLLLSIIILSGCATEPRDVTDQWRTEIDRQNHINLIESLQNGTNTAVIDLVKPNLKDPNSFTFIDANVEVVDTTNANHIHFLNEIQEKLGYSLSDGDLFVGWVYTANNSFGVPVYGTAVVLMNSIGGAARLWTIE